MGESVIRTTGRSADENQTRRSERGIVAGYIHEISQRHGSHAAELDAGQASEADEGA